MFRNKDDDKGSREDEAWRQEASAIWHDAKAAAERGDAWFACVFIVAESGGSFGLGKAVGRMKTISPAPVIASVEELGWRLDKADHVFVQTTGSTVGPRGGMSPEIVGGVVQGHYLFQRTERLDG